MNELPTIGTLPLRRSELIEAANKSGAPTKPSTSHVIRLEPKDRFYDMIEREQLPSDVKASLAGALTGDLHRQGMLFDSMIDSRSRLQTNLDEVTTKVSKAPLKVVPFSPKGA